MKLRFLQYAVLLVTLIISSTTSAQDCQDNWLSTKGNKIVDINGNQVTFSGLNWFGFEQDVGFPNGIGWQGRSMKGILQQVKDLGFNSLRLPWSNDNLLGDRVISINSWSTDPYTGNGPNDLQEESEVSTPLEILDIMVRWCEENDMKIILDNHSRFKNGYNLEPLWYTDGFSHQQWIDDWVFLAERYKDYSAVVAMDLNNEPHGSSLEPDKYSVYANWGNGDPSNDWKMAAQECGNAILEVNPNVLIMVEGIQEYLNPSGEYTNYWWGGNLQGVREHPIELSDMSKLVYSPHEYGPRVHPQEWFFVDEFPGNLEGIWETQFNFINTQEIAPLYIGEIGIQSEDSVDYVWFKELVDFIKEKQLHYAYWCLNPNSGDTGGIFQDDWFTINQWKMDLIQPILFDPIPNCVVYTGVVLSNEEFNAEVVDFSVYPNPTVDVVTFSTSSNNIKSVQLFDLNGKELQITSGIASASAYEFDLSNLADGVYLAKVISEKGVSTTVKVIKE